MEPSIEFTKYEDEHFACFVCKDGGWQLSRELGFHKCSPARDYMVQWAENNNRWSLYISNYTTVLDVNKEYDGIIITTVDTVFDVLDYICKNKHTHY